MTGYKRLDPLPPSADKSHHVTGQQAKTTAFRNPWPSFPATSLSLGTVLRTRFFDKKPPFVPVPSDRAELVQVRSPEFGILACTTPSFKVIWIGHAAFLVQCWFPGMAGFRSLNILLDPVFSQRTSPVTFMGPKRYTPVPCTLPELLDAVPIDVVCISHNHYDHADTTTLKAVYEHRKSQGEKVLLCVGLGNARWLTPLAIPSDQIVEADWWDRIEIPLPGMTAVEDQEADHLTSTPQSVRDEKAVRITCVPSQHASNRGIFDRNQDLWCGWVLELVDAGTLPGTNASVSTTAAGAENSTTATLTSHSLTNPTSQVSRYKSIYFSGDTGYRTVLPSTSTSTPTSPSKDSTGTTEEISPPCPAFAQIGTTLGPFDLSLLPIGLNRPRHFMSSVHANASDSIQIHHDVRSRRSIGMHWGTVRGGISAYYEDVRDPPLEWEAEAKKAGLTFRPRGDDTNKEWEIGLVDVGETLIV